MALNASKCNRQMPLPFKWFISFGSVFRPNILCSFCRQCYVRGVWYHSVVVRPCSIRSTLL